MRLICGGLEKSSRSRSVTVMYRQKLESRFCNRIEGLFNRQLRSRFRIWDHGAASLARLSPADAPPEGDSGTGIDVYGTQLCGTGCPDCNYFCFCRYFEGSPFCLRTFETTVAHPVISAYFAGFITVFLSQDGASSARQSRAFCSFARRSFRSAIERSISTAHSA